MRVLLVEDDAMIGRSLDRALSDSGMAVDWVRSAADCMLAFRDCTYNLLLLDLGLPDGSGLEILRDIRRSSTKTPVIVITARDDVTTRIAGLDGGADDYVVKPFDFDELSA
jgi:two-component system, OmpR family, response regulator